LIAFIYQELPIAIQFKILAIARVTGCLTKDILQSSIFLGGARAVKNEDFYIFFLRLV